MQIQKIASNPGKRKDHSRSRLLEDADSALSSAFCLEQQSPVRKQRQGPTLASQQGQRLQGQCSSRTSGLFRSFEASISRAQEKIPQNNQIHRPQVQWAVTVGQFQSENKDNFNT